MPIFASIKWWLLLVIGMAFFADADESLGEQVAPQNAELNKAYEQVLFEYYQGNFAQGLTKMAVLEQKYPQGLLNISSTLSGEIAEPELLKGGMSLAYGLDHQAEEIFSRLLEENTSEEVSVFAWLLLGETYYQNREFTKAAQTFAKISIEQAEQFLDTATRDHWLYMQSQLHGFLVTTDSVTSYSTDIQASAPWLDELSANSIYRQYVAYNQALGLLQNDDIPQAIDELKILASSDTGFVQNWMNWASPLFTEDKDEQAAERQAISDRANLTLAYTLLQQDEPYEAFRTFENIRTDGLDGDAALLGYGWAAAKKEDWQVALAIWQRLIQKPEHTEYNLEAYLASAYAYERAFAPRQSMQMLQLGIERFKDTQQLLSRAQVQVSQRQFILDLLPTIEQSQQNDPANSTGGNVALLEQKAQQLNAQHIFQSISVSNEFRSGIKALNDSHVIQQELLNWRQRMQQYYVMLDERKTERSQRAKNILHNRTLEKLDALKSKRDQLASMLNKAQQQQNGTIFMPTEYQDWLTRVKRSQQRLHKIAELKSQLNQSPLADAYAKRLKRVSGRLIWLSNEALPKNTWQAKKALAQLDTELTDAERRQQKLLAKLSAQPDYQQQRQRVEQLTERVDVQINKNQHLQDALISQLSGIFSQAIQQHQAKVTNYLQQAQLAIVRLSDQALQKDEGDLIEKDQAEQGVPQ